MLQQILYIIGCLCGFPLLPILAYQGKKVKKNMPDLPEATENITGQITGKHPLAIHLLAIGESSIAGVGIKDHQFGLTGQVAKLIYELRQVNVYWQVVGKSGYTAQKTNQELVPQIPDLPYDIILIGLGGNDTFQLNSPLTFRKNMIQLIDNLLSRHPQSKIVMINMPPVADFPAFPHPFRFFLGNLAKLHGAVIRNIPLLYPNVYYVDGDMTLKDWQEVTQYAYQVNDFFSDGVHPSALSYALGGEKIAKFIVKQGIV